MKILNVASKNQKSGLLESSFRGPPSYRVSANYISCLSKHLLLIWTSFLYFSPSASHQPEVPRCWAFLGAAIHILYYLQRLHLHRPRRDPTRLFHHHLAQLYQKWVREELDFFCNFSSVLNFSNPTPAGSSLPFKWLAMDKTHRFLSFSPNPKMQADYHPDSNFWVCTAPTIDGYKGPFC